MVAVSEYMGGTRISGSVSIADDVLEMRVVCGVRRVGGVCEMCICLARGGVGGVVCEWMMGLGLGFNNPVGTGGVWDVCLGFGCDVGSDRRMGEWLGPGSGMVGGVMSVCVVRLDYLCGSQVPVCVYWLGGYLRILGTPSVKSCCTISISLLVCDCRTWINIEI